MPLLPQKRGPSDFVRVARFADIWKPLCYIHCVQINCRYINDEPNVLKGLFDNQLFVAIAGGELLLQVQSCFCIKIKRAQNAFALIEQWPVQEYLANSSCQEISCSSVFLCLEAHTTAC